MCASERIPRLPAGPVQPEYRQVAVVDRAGATAHFTGARTLGTNSVSTGAGCVAAGNLLADRGVPEAMASAFAAHESLMLAERLLTAAAIICPR